MSDTNPYEPPQHLAPPTANESSLYWVWLLLAVTYSVVATAASVFDMILALQQFFLSFVLGALAGRSRFFVWRMLVCLFWLSQFFAESSWLRCSMDLPFLGVSLAIGFAIFKDGIRNKRRFYKFAWFGLSYLVGSLLGPMGAMVIPSCMLLIFRIKTKAELAKGDSADVALFGE